MWYRDIPISTLLGLTLTELKDTGDSELLFSTTCGRTFKLYHSQDCCERVVLDDICGDLQDLVDSRILMAEEVDNEPPTRPADEYEPESETWTFYKLATVKGYVTLRWHGSSNGYYSEGVNFIETTPGTEKKY